MPVMAVQLNVAELGVTKDEVIPVGALQIFVAILKLVLLISKNIFPTDSIFILAVVELITGMTSVSVPSFGVLVDNIVGKLNPPSVLNEIFTLAQLTGDAAVPAEPAGDADPDGGGTRGAARHVRRARRVRLHDQHADDVRRDPRDRPARR